MLPAENQARLTEALLRIEDPLERLAYTQDRAKRLPPLEEAFRAEAFRIKGCMTKLWLRPQMKADLCFFDVDSESAVVRGLAALYAEVYSGATPAEIAAFDCTILAAIKLESRITPTRLQGLALLQQAIRSFAKAHLNPAAE
ncbi:MAG: SufE family protein [Verrucomicrobia bacterium]|nr:SufE family protein [Verrucomicrobiota bacterium]